MTNTTIAEQTRPVKSNWLIIRTKARSWIANGIEKSDDQDDVIYTLSRYYWTGDTEKNVFPLGRDDQSRAELIYALFKKSLKLSVRELKGLWIAIVQKCTYRKNVEKRREKNWHQYHPETGLNEHNEKVQTSAREKIIAAYVEFVQKFKTQPSVYMIRKMCGAGRDTIVKYMKYLQDTHTEICAQTAVSREHDGGSVPSNAAPGQQPQIEQTPKLSTNRSFDLSIFFRSVLIRSKKDLKAIDTTNQTVCSMSKLKPGHGLDTTDPVFYTGKKHEAALSDEERNRAVSLCSLRFGPDYTQGELQRMIDFIRQEKEILLKASTRKVHQFC